MVLQRVVGPENRMSHMFALLRDRPEFASATTDLRMLDSSGRLVDAKVTWVRRTVEGPQPQCGFLVQPDFPVRMPLDGPLLPSDWTAEINYLANSDGSLIDVAVGGSRGQGAGSAGPQPGVRAATRRGRCDRRPGQHRRVVRVRRVGTGRIRGAEIARATLVHMTDVREQGVQVFRELLPGVLPEGDVDVRRRRSAARCSRSPSTTSSAACGPAKA